MSVKHAMLALLSAHPSSTYRLRQRFDASTGQSWPLNIGQVSTTLQRLERDGLVRREQGEVGEPWHLTDEGRAELSAWWARPVVTEQRGRDELVIKLMLAATTPRVDVEQLVQAQRSATQRGLHDLTRLRREAEDLIGRLVLDHHIFMAEAELRWLQDVEGGVQRAAAEAMGEVDSADTDGVDATEPTLNTSTNGATR